MKSTTKTMIPLTVASLLMGLTVSTQAAVIFSENFDTSNQFVPAGELLNSVTYTDAAIEGQLGVRFMTTYNANINTATLTETFALDLIGVTLEFNHFRRDTGVSGGRPVTAQIGYKTGVSTFNLLATETFAAVSDVTVLETRTLSYLNTGGAEIGNQIMIRFVSNAGDGTAGFQAGIDNVTLTTIVPEPSSLALLLGGFATLMAARQRRKTA